MLSVIRYLLSLGAMLCLITSIACKKEIAVFQAPQVVRNTIQHELGHLTVDEIARYKEGDEVIYEVHATIRRKEMELRIAEDGILLQKQEELAPEELPVRVRSTLQDALGEVPEAGDITRNAFGQHTLYRVEAELPDGKVELRIAEDGTLLMGSSDRDDESNGYDVDGGVLLQVELIEKSESPTLRDISPYREALVVYEYRVRRCIRGSFNDVRVRVAHWAIYDEQPQRILETEIGSKSKLDLRPFSQIEELESIYMRGARNSGPCVDNV